MVGKNALKYSLFLGCLTLHHTFSLWGYGCNFNYLYCSGHLWGKSKFFYLDAIRTGLKDKSRSAATWLKYRDHLVSHCPYLVKRAVRVVPQAAARPIAAAPHRGRPRPAAHAVSIDTVNLQPFAMIELKARQQLSYSILCKSETMWQDFNLIYLIFTVQTLWFLKKDITVLVFQSWHSI